MGEKGVFVARSLVSILLVFALAIFSLLLSVSVNISGEKIDSVIGEVVSEMVEERISSQDIPGVNEEINTEQIYGELISECNDSDLSILEEETGIKITCEEISKAGEEGVEDLVKSKIEGRIKEEVQTQLNIPNLGNILTVIDIAMVFFGLLCLVLVLLIYLLSVPRSKFFVDLGIVLLISGIPFLFAKMVRFDIPFESVNQILERIISDIFTISVILAILGVLMILIGAIFVRAFGNKKSDSKEGTKFK